MGLMSSLDGYEEFGGCPPARLQEYLFLGGAVVCEDDKGMKRHGVTHVLNVADDIGCYFPDQFVYRHITNEDGGEDDSIVAAFAEATEFVRQVKSTGGLVLCHCFMGINRSACVAMAVQMNLEGLSLREVYEHTKARREQLRLAPGNLQKIAQWEQ